MGNKRLLAVGLGLVIGLAGLGVAFAQSPVPGATGPTGTHSGQRIAAKLAKVSGQTVAQVEALKAKDGTWPAVAKALGLTPARFHGKFGRQRIAAKLAKASGQTVVQVEALKAKDGTWRTVVKDLGLTPAQIWGQTTQLPTPAN